MPRVKYLVLYRYYNDILNQAVDGKYFSISSAIIILKVLQTRTTYMIKKHAWMGKTAIFYTHFMNIIEM